MKLRTLSVFALGIVAGNVSPTPTGVVVYLFLCAVAGLIASIEVAK